MALISIYGRRSKVVAISDIVSAVYGDGLIEMLEFYEIFRPYFFQIQQVIRL